MGVTLSQTELQQARQEFKDSLKRNEELLVEAYRQSIHNGNNGWDRPPALIPSAFETAMGIGYDPRRNTR